MEREWRYMAAEVIISRTVNASPNGQLGVLVPKADLLAMLDEIREQRATIRELRAERLKLRTWGNWWCAAAWAMAVIAGLIVWRFR